MKSIDGIVKNVALRIAIKCGIGRFKPILRKEIRAAIEAAEPIHRARAIRDLKAELTGPSSVLREIPT